MPSTALTSWRDARKKRLDEIVAAHQTIGGTGRGRRWQTREVNWALTLRLAGEFQGFARDLHDLATDYIVIAASDGNAQLEQMLRKQATARRGLDRGNASSRTLTEDFARLDLTLWPVLMQADQRAAEWKSSLDNLIEARNAIAHVDDVRIMSLRVTLSVVKKWRRDLDLLTACMDDVVSTYLDVLIGRGRPW